MLPRIGDRAALWQRPDPRRWLVFALVGVLFALSFAFLSVEEAQAKEKGSPGQGPVEKAVGGADKAVRKDSNGGAAGSAADKASRGEENTRDAVAPGSTPPVDRPAQVNATPKTTAVERADRAYEESIRPVLKEAAKPVDEPALDKTDSTASAALDEVTPAVDRVLEKAEKPAVEPVLREATSATEPILEETAPTVEPVLQEAVLAAEPVLREATPPVGPVLEVAPPVVEPVLESAGPVAELAGEVAEPVASSPLLEAASPAETVEPVPEAGAPTAAVPVPGETLPPAGPPGLAEAAPPTKPGSETPPPPVGTVTEAAVPEVGPVFETTAPVAGSGEVTAFGSADGSALAETTHGAPTVWPETSSHAPLAGSEARGASPEPRAIPAALVEVRKSSSPGSTGEVRPSAAGLSGSYSGPFGRSSSVDGHHAFLPDAAAAQGFQGPKPSPFPFGFPSGAPPAGSSLGASGVVVLDLLGVLALFLILPRVGRSSWPFLGPYKPNFSLRLAVERPG